MPADVPGRVIVGDRGATDSSSPGGDVDERAGIIGRPKIEAQSYRRPVDDPS